MSAKRHILSSLTGIVIGLMLASAAQAVPIAIMGNSGDVWEHRPSDYSESLGTCAPVPDYRVALVEGNDDVAALLEASVQPLDPAVAIQKLGYRPAPRGSASSGAFSDAVRQIEKRRKKALSKGPDRWSAADQIERGRITALRYEVESDNYRPYLVRAFRWRDRPLNLSVDLCSGYVRIMSSTQGSTPNPPPERATAIIFLQVPPKGSFAMWLEKVLPEPDFAAQLRK